MIEGLTLGLVMGVTLRQIILPLYVRLWVRATYGR